MHWIDCAYVYDGTFAGLLCCVFDSYTRKESPVSISASEQEQTSLYPIHVVQTVPSHAKRITTSLYAKSPKAVNLIKLAFLTCLPDKELCIYQMILQLLLHYANQYLYLLLKLGQLIPALFHHQIYLHKQNILLI